MARARRAPFNRQGLEFKTASLQRAARLFGTAFASSPFEEATTEKVQSRLSFARQTALRGVTAARRTSACGLLRSGVDGLNVRLDDSEANVSVQLLAPLIQYETWTAFDAHLVGVLVVCS